MELDSTVIRTQITRVAIYIAKKKNERNLAQQSQNLIEKYSLFKSNMAEEID